MTRPDFSLSTLRERRRHRPRKTRYRLAEAALVGQDSHLLDPNAEFQGFTSIPSAQAWPGAP